MEAAVGKGVVYLPVSLQLHLVTGVAFRLLNMEKRSRHPLDFEIQMIVCEGFLQMLSAPSLFRQSVVEVPPDLGSLVASPVYCS